MNIDTHLQSLQDIVGAENVSVRGSDLEAHSVDESWADPHLPDVVVWPNSEEQISELVRYANEQDLPVVPWSGGSSLEGNPIPVQGGILLAMYRMNKILEIREEDLQVTVQPGVIYDDLNKQLRRLGMYFPQAPGSSDVATIGGMVSNNSSGMRAVKYGVTRDYVLNLRVVLPDGRIVQLGNNARKSTSGYDLKSLFVGSEGTLGVVTEITLRLVGYPETVACLVAVYDEIGDAANTVYESIRFGLDPSAIEILDSGTVHAINTQQELSLQERPTLFVEFHGSEAGVQEQIDYLRELAEDNNCLDIQAAVTPEEREKLWAARSEAHDSIKFSHPGTTMIAGDVCLPLSKFVEMNEFVAAAAKEFDVLIYAFGHAGDGNLHTETIAHRDDPDEFNRGIEATNAIVRHAISLGGTTAGEHGVGLLKREFMVEEHGETLSIMQSIKDLIDPKGIMNPGKVFPDSVQASV